MSPDERPNQSRPTAAFVASLIAGLWMLLAGGMAGWGFMGGHGWGWGGHMMSDGHHSGGTWMWNHQMMHAYGGGMLWSWTGIIAAAMVLLGAVFLYTRPAAAKGWGVVILVASALAILAGAGGFLAGVLGLIGGVLAITWRPQAS